MQFRWVIGIALWTILSGPVFAPPQSAPRWAQQQTTAAPKSGEVGFPPGIDKPLVQR